MIINDSDRQLTEQQQQQLLQQVKKTGIKAGPLPYPLVVQLVDLVVHVVLQLMNGKPWCQVRSTQAAGSLPVPPAQLTIAEAKKNLKGLLKELDRFGSTIGDDVRITTLVVTLHWKAGNVQGARSMDAIQRAAFELATGA